MKLHEVIKVLLNNKNITQKDLCKKVKKSQTAMSQLMTGKYNFSEDTLIKISEVLEIPVPILHFLALEEKDVPENKIEIFKAINPAMNNLLNEVFNFKN